MFENLTLNWQFFAGFLIIAVAAYLIGSINFAIITTKIKAHEDIRDYGSGNAGMTNVLRTQGKGPAAIVLVGDFLKGVIAVCIGYLVGWWLMGPDVMKFGGYVGFFFVLLGHLFPVFISSGEEREFLLLPELFLPWNRLFLELYWQLLS